MRPGDRAWRERRERERRRFDRAWRILFPICVLLAVLFAAFELALYAGAATYLWSLVP